MKFSKPGDLIKASRDPKMKQSVMKAIGMRTKKASGPVKTSGAFQGKSNKLGQGGRAAQLKARGVPGGVIGNLARAAQAAPGQKNFHKTAKKRKTAKKEHSASAINGMKKFMSEEAKEKKASKKKYAK